MAKYFWFTLQTRILVFNTYVHRVLNICSTSALLTSELNYVEDIDGDRGYSSSTIDCIYMKLTKPHIIE